MSRCPALRYLLLATHVPPNGSGGGVVRYTVALAEALAQREDVELHVLASEDSAEFFARLVPSEQVHRVSRAPTGLHALREWTGTVFALRRLHFDLIHGTKHIVPLAARGATRVLTVHDMLLVDRPGDYPLAKRLLLRSPYLSSIHRADVLVAVSAASRARLVDYLPDTAARTAVVPLAASSALVDAVPEPAPDLVGKRFALAVGDASLHKNVRLAVRTWPFVRKGLPDAVLVLVGPAPWGPEDTGGEMWERLVAEGAVQQMRGISDGMLRWLYEHADALLCPSLVEGFGLPAAEATALGTPVVTSDDPALSEAAAGWCRPTAAWSDRDWGDTVLATMTDVKPSGDTYTKIRTWDDVAADTIAAIVGQSAGNVLSSPMPLPTRPQLSERIGVSPYRAPLQVQHIVDADDPCRGDVERIVAEHNRLGWSASVSTLGRHLPLPGPEIDAVVLYGRRPGWQRLRLRGAATTIVLTRPPNGFRDRIVSWWSERLLARWTHALVLPGGPGARSAGRSGAPVTRLDRDSDGALEIAGIIARARAWGRDRRVVGPPSQGLNR